MENKPFEESFTGIGEAKLRDDVANYLVRKMRKEAAEECAEYLATQYIFKARPTGTMQPEELWQFKDGVYTLGARAFIKAYLQRVLGTLADTSLTNEIINKVAAKTMLPYSEQTPFGNTPPDLICVENGIVNITTWELSPHTPDLFFVSKLPVTFNPDSRNRLFADTVVGVLKGKQIPTFQEFFGYCLLGDCRFKKALLLYGGTNTGKTTLLNAVQNFFGQGKFSNKKIGEFDSHFSVSETYGKYVNIGDDLDEKDIRNPGIFKQMTSDGWLRGEQKYGAVFSFRASCKHIFSANIIPIPHGKEGKIDDAYYNRFIILRTEQDFTNRADRLLSMKMNTPEAKEGMLLFGLQGIRRLMKEGRFMLEQPIDEVRRIMLSSASSIAAFAEERLQMADDTEIGKEDMYRTYCGYCHECGRAVATKDSFGKQLGSFCTFLSEGQSSKGGKRSRVWRNVIMKGGSVKPTGNTKKQPSTPLWCNGGLFPKNTENKEGDTSE